MLRIQIFVDRDLFPDMRADLTPAQEKVAGFIGGLAPFVAEEFDVPQENVRWKTWPMDRDSGLDGSPANVDVTMSIKHVPGEGLDAKNQALYDFAKRCLGEEIKVGIHLFPIPEDSWKIG